MGIIVKAEHLWRGLEEKRQVLCLPFCFTVAMLLFYVVPIEIPCNNSFSQKVLEPSGIWLQLNQYKRKRSKIWESWWILLKWVLCSFHHSSCAFWLSRSVFVCVHSSDSVSDNVFMEKTLMRNKHSCLLVKRLYNYSQGPWEGKKCVVLLVRYCVQGSFIYWEHGVISKFTGLFGICLIVPWYFISVFIHVMLFSLLI